MSTRRGSAVSAKRSAAWFVGAEARVLQISPELNLLLEENRLKSHVVSLHGEATGRQMLSDINTMKKDVFRFTQNSISDAMMLEFIVNHNDENNDENNNVDTIFVNLRQDMIRLLTCCVLQHPRPGYAQGFHTMAALVLSVEVRLDHAFSLFTCLTQEIMPRDYWERPPAAMNGLQVELDVLLDLALDVLPGLGGGGSGGGGSGGSGGDMIVRTSVHMIAVQCLVPLFVDYVNIKTTLLIWDKLFDRRRSDGEKKVVRRTNVPMYSMLALLSLATSFESSSSNQGVFSREQLVEGVRNAEPKVFQKHYDIMLKKIPTSRLKEMRQIAIRNLGEQWSSPLAVRKLDEADSVRFGKEDLENIQLHFRTLIGGDNTKKKTKKKSNEHSGEMSWEQFEVVVGDLVQRKRIRLPGSPDRRKKQTRTRRREKGKEKETETETGQNGKMEEVNDVDVVFLFGRPGAGKTTIAESVVDLHLRLSSSDYSSNRQHHLLKTIDLDVCVPQWMRDNFAIGKYPTLKERNDFARDAAEYVASHVRGMKSSLSSSSTTNTSISTRTSMLLVSFSFVNEDLRIYFRQFFPHGRWILLDTKENMAKERIDKREGHFYKNQTEQTEQIEQKQDVENKSSAEWRFAPVSFPHLSLDGSNTVKNNTHAVWSHLVERVSNSGGDGDGDRDRDGDGDGGESSTPTQPFLSKTSQLFLKRLFALADRSNSGYVDFRELICLLSTMCRGSIAERLSLCFATFDRQSTGYLACDDIRLLVDAILLSKHAEERDEEEKGEEGRKKIKKTPLRRKSIMTTETEQMIEMLDVDGDGRVSLDDFVSFMSNDADLMHCFGFFGVEEVEVVGKLRTFTSNEIENSLLKLISERPVTVVEEEVQTMHLRTKGENKNENDTKDMDATDQCSVCSVM